MYKATTTALLGLLFAVGCAEGPAGADGATGADGAVGELGDDATPTTNGYSVLTETQEVDSLGFGCADGYKITWFGVDNGEGGGVAADGLLQDGEIVVETISCLGETE